MGAALNHATRTQRLKSAGFLLLLLLVLWVIQKQVGSASQATKLEFDRLNLQHVLAGIDYDNDPLLDSYLLSEASRKILIKQETLGLGRDRLAYIAKKANDVVAIVIPATADDGFNGQVDLLIAVDMLGHIVAVKVIRSPASDDLYGVVDIIESQWLKQFDTNSMRDIRRISWQKIDPDNEYDLFVGASITAKTVSEQIYNAMVFVQSNRIALMAGDD